MTGERVKRKISAIFSADVEGYSRLMGDDEVATVRTLENYRTLMVDLIGQHRGRVVDSPGDNLLAEFGSVVDAVQCAVEIQQILKAKNAELPENRRMQFRIGVNLGDVIEEGERIYGDGVNIAARIEGLAEGGGICVSGSAYEQIENKLALGYEYLGEHTVKNITKPVRVYKVPMELGARKEKKAGVKQWKKVAVAAAAVIILGAGAFAIWNFYFRPPPMEVASEERMAFPLPEKPSIAVLPFVNMSEDKGQEFFCDGITEEIITALSKTPQMFVIARNSTFSYKGKQVKVQQVAEELGVRYVLEGSVRKSEDRLRITAQLIDAITGRHLWAERYDRDLKDIFALQDEITLKILNALRVKLTDGMYASVIEKGTNNLEAYLKLLQAREYGLRGTKEGNAMQRKLSEEVITLAPDYPMAYLSLSATHLMDLIYGTSKSPIQSLRLAEELVQKALTLDDNSAWGHAYLGRIYLTKRQYEKAITQGERALALDPNSDFVQAALAFTLRNAGRHEEAIALFKKAIRLNPIPPPWYLFSCGFSHLILGQYEEATVEFKKALRRSPENLFAHVGLAATYSALGREKDAQAEAEEILRIDPKFTLEAFAKGILFKNQADIDRTIEALRKAGLPDKPPLPLPDKPSIAVLPFVNMSEDPKQEYFSDGITEEIITALSKIPKLFVIARNSTFTYKGKPVKVQQVAEELGVRYVLEGSVRKAGDKVRVTAQLVDAQTGHHLWAERYDRDLKDIFALQDEITMKIVTALRVKLTDGEQARLSAKGTDNLEAYLKYLQGREYGYRFNEEDNVLARQMAKEAIALDPNYAGPYTLMAVTHMMDVWLGWTKSPRESLERTEKLAQKALSIDDSYAHAHVLLGYVYLLKRRHDNSIAEMERAVALAPNASYNIAAFAFALNLAGSPEEAIVWYKKAIRLDPIPRALYFLQLGHIYRNAGRYEEAISTLKKALPRNPDNLLVHLHLAASYNSLNRKEEAHAEAAEVLRIDPKFSLQYFAKTIPYKDQADTERLVEALHKAGLK